MFNAVNEFLDDLRGGRMTENPIVRVEQGELQGRLVSTPGSKAYYSFQGIPYAKPPLGSLRFKAPQPIEPWEGVRDATAEGNVSAQIDPIFAKSYVGDENCLFLNVYTPNLDGEFLPVMVYIHGGGFIYGSGNTDMYGPDYLVEKDVVVVTINYRLGVLGFLSLNTPEVPGNAGMKDMILALNWVKENIHNFGGNAGNLTIFGESAGASAVSLLTASPLSKHLMSKAIIQSGPLLWSLGLQKNPIENAMALAKTLGCDADNVDDVLEFLNATPAKDIVEAHAKLHPFGGFESIPDSFNVVIEKEFPGVDAVLTESLLDIVTSGRVARVPIMVGSTTLEFAFERKTDDLQIAIPEELNIERNSEEAIAIIKEFEKLYFKGNPNGVESLTDYYRLISDKFINVSTHRYIKYLVQSTNMPIYYYKFDYVGELNIYTKTLTTLDLKHAMHLDDLGYLFKNDFQKDVEPTPQDLKMREIMVRLWTNFAKTGNPTPEENTYITVTWLPVTKENLYYLNLGQELSLGTNPDKEKMEFWDELYSKHFKIWDHPRTNDTEVPRKEAITDAVTETVTETVITENVTESGSVVTFVENTVTDGETAVTETLVFVQESTESPPEPRIAKFEAPEPPKEAFIEAEVPAPESPKLPETPAPQSPKLPETPAPEPLKFTEAAPITNGVERKQTVRTSNEIKMVVNNGVPKDVIRANDPPEDDLPKNIGVNKFVNFFESLGGKK